MTDTIDVAALVERHRHQINGTGPWRTAGPDEAMQELATALQSQADALAEARRDLNKYAYQRDNAREERDAAERRSEGFWKPQADKATARATAAEASLATMREALEQIVQWSKAYPLKAFPEPDFAKVRELLAAGGITVDAVSASNMRHVVTEVGAIAHRALGGSNAE